MSQHGHKTVAGHNGPCSRLWHDSELCAVKHYWFIVYVLLHYVDKCVNCKTMIFADKPINSLSLWRGHHYNNRSTLCMNFSANFFVFLQVTVNLKKLRTLTLQMCKRFHCKQCCCSVVLILKAVSYVLLLKTGVLLPGAIRDRRTRVALLEIRHGWQHTGRQPDC